MSERRRFHSKGRELTLYTKRFYPAGTYTWIVPQGCTSVDVFLVGAGAAGQNAIGGGGGYTKTYKSSSDGWKDGDAIKVTPGQSIQVIVGKGMLSTEVPDDSSNGGHWCYITNQKQANYSQFMNSNYRAEGGWTGGWINEEWTYHSGDGGSGGSTEAYNNAKAGIDGNGDQNYRISGTKSTGQGHTTRDFGESSSPRNAGGGGTTYSNMSWTISHSEGKGGDTSNNSSTGGLTYYGGEGYGGGGACFSYYATNETGQYMRGGNGGDGTVLIRYYAY